MIVCARARGARRRQFYDDDDGDDADEGEFVCGNDGTGLGNNDDALMNRRSFCLLTRAAW